MGHAEGSLRAKAKTALMARGEPMIWLTGGCLAIAGAMIVALLALVLYQGLTTFKPISKGCRPLPS